MLLLAIVGFNVMYRKLKGIYMIVGVQGMLPPYITLDQMIHC